MSILFEETIRPTDTEIREAIAIRCSECFTAMLWANALGGGETMPWRIIKTFKLPEMIAEAESRGIDLTKLPVAVGEEPKQMVSETERYRRAALAPRETEGTK
jgi:hypothetical protein